MAVVAPPAPPPEGCAAGPRSICLVSGVRPVLLKERWLPLLLFHHLKTAKITSKITANPAIEPTTLPTTTGVEVDPFPDSPPLPASDVLVDMLPEVVDVPVPAVPPIDVPPLYPSVVVDVGECEVDVEEKADEKVVEEGADVEDESWTDDVAVDVR